MDPLYCITIPAGIGLFTPSDGASALQEDGQRLLVGDLGPGLELGERAGADRVLDLGEGVVGNAQHAGDVLGRHLERCRADHHRPFAELLEGDAVVQTARRAGPSIPQAGYQKVDVGGDLDQRVGGRRGAGVLLGGQLDDRTAMSLHEELGHLVQHLLGIELAVFQGPDARAAELGECGRARALARGRGRGGSVELHGAVLLYFLARGRMAACCMIEPRPRLHDGRKHEWPPASPPPRGIRISSGTRPRCTNPCSASAWAASPCWESYSRSRNLPTPFMPSTERLAWVNRKFCASFRDQPASATICMCSGARITTLWPSVMQP